MDGRISYEDICTKIRSLHPRILLCGGTFIKQVLNFSLPRQNENTVGLREEGFPLVHYKLVLPPLPPDYIIPHLESLIHLFRPLCISQTAWRQEIPHPQLPGKF